MDKARAEVLRKRRIEDDKYYADREERSALRNKKFNLWIERNPLHRIDTGELIGWENTTQTGNIIIDCWRDGESPLQRFNRLSTEDGEIQSSDPQ